MYRNDRAVSYRNQLINLCRCLIVSGTHISADFDLFFPLKNSGSARFSIEWMLTKIDTMVLRALV